VAVAAALPLLAPEVWSGFRIALSDPARAVVAPIEQPLSVRSPVGLWAIGLSVAWFGLGYWRRNLRWYDAALVLAGGSLALARLGNAWLDAILVVVPLGRELASVPLPRGAAVLGGLAGLAMTATSVALGRPPEVSPAAVAAAARSAPDALVFADWRWAPTLQHDLADRAVLASGGLATQSHEFWLDYVRISRGHARWAALLQQLDVAVVVLEPSAQQPASELIRASADWRVLYDAPDALVAERAGR
jgi:hypothetical protein